jgi:RHH-type proline utilization regulon transcriptional repressor/proline dehydrogenase/delta 1-pyrroline-5-carboxylate dehydrogenase
MDELYPRLRDLAVRARRHDIGLNIDAEEADRLELSLDLLERLCLEPALAGWNGIGFVIQAYQKRCPAVVDWLVDLARRSGHRLMIRLVKGAYWDSEIKRAQQDGQDGYPVYTRKLHTDVSYLACARALLAAPDAIYPQFATHNAHTVAAIVQLAGANFYAGQYEFQCLHGMGEPLYEQVVGPVAAGGLARPCRIYAPVGTHETLLAYLVRRLLENGANTSFVNRIADPSVPLTELVADPVAAARSAGRAGRPGRAAASAHPAAARPVRRGPGQRGRAGPGQRGHPARPGRRAARQRRPGLARRAASGRRGAAAGAATGAQPGRPPGHRGHGGRGQRRRRRGRAGRRDGGGPALGRHAAAGAGRLPAARRRRAGGRHAPTAGPAGPRSRQDPGQRGGRGARGGGLPALLRRQARGFDPATHGPLGPVVCISPWNFPLAIFTGQVAAALAAGNPVLAKPAEQTPLVAAEAVRLLHAAGVPADVLQLLPGDGETSAPRWWPTRARRA